MVKIICGVCGVEGSLQQRGNSYRVGHYRGYKGETRIIEWHKVTAEMVNNGKQCMVNKNLKSSSDSENNCRGSVVRTSRQTHNLENKKRASA